MSSYYEKPAYNTQYQGMGGEKSTQASTITKKIDFTSGKKLPNFPQKSKNSVRSLTPPPRTQGKVITPQRPIIPHAKVYLPPKPRMIQQPALISSPINISKTQNFSSPKITPPGNYHYVANSNNKIQKHNIVTPVGSRRKMEKTRIEVVDHQKGEERNWRRSESNGKMSIKGPIGSWQTIDHNRKSQSTLNLNKFGNATPVNNDKIEAKNPKIRNITPVKTKNMTPGRHPIDVKRIEISSKLKNSLHKLPPVNTNNSNLNNSNKIINKNRELEFINCHLEDSKECLTNVNNCLNSDKYKKFSQNKQREIEDWKRRITEANLEHKKRISTLIDNLKYQVASEIGAEEMFYELDVLASKLKPISLNEKYSMNNLTNQKSDGKRNTYEAVNKKILKNSQLLNRNSEKRERINLNEDTAVKSNYTIRRSPDRDVNYSKIKVQVMDNAVQRKIKFNSQNKKLPLESNRAVRSQSPLKKKIETEIQKEKNRLNTPNQGEKRIGVAKPVSEFSPSNSTVQTRKEIQVRNFLLNSPF